jgi:hypothetical protein
MSIRAAPSRTFHLAIVMTGAADNHEPVDRELPATSIHCGSIG